MAHRIRWALTQEPVKEALSGIIEMDETYIGGKKKGQGIQAAMDCKTPVVSLVERGGGVRSFTVDHVTAKNLKPIVDECGHPESHVHTDDAMVYPFVLKGKVASHATVNHSKNEYSRREAGKVSTTNSVEGFFAIMKKGNYGFDHHWSKKYMGQYLREYDWRYNVRAVPDAERVVIALKTCSGRRLKLKSSGAQQGK